MIRAQRDGRRRCHSRQRTGLPSSVGPYPSAASSSEPFPDARRARPLGAAPLVDDRRPEPSHRQRQRGPPRSRAPTARKSNWSPRPGLDGFEGSWAATVSPTGLVLRSQPGKCSWLRFATSGGRDHHDPDGPDDIRRQQDLVRLLAPDRERQGQRAAEHRHAHDHQERRRSGPPDRSRRARSPAPAPAGCTRPGRAPARASPRACRARPRRRTGRSPARAAASPAPCPGRSPRPSPRARPA